MSQPERNLSDPGEAIPIAPAFLEQRGAALASQPPLLDARVLQICVHAMLLAVVAASVAQLLTALIGLVTNLVYYGRVSSTFVSPAGHRLGPLVAVLVPVLGGLCVGLMARYGSQAIRGHGIPEAMEQVLKNHSRIPYRMTFLKPLSAAIAIGTGGPFGAEGPIIATGGALGSLLGQVLPTSAAERKTLLAAGAAAGMAATFGSPLSAVLLAVELLLFEYRPRSLVPVALAAAVASGVRAASVGSGAVFPMPELAPPTAAALGVYVLIGALLGLCSVGVTRAVYWVETAFERLPLHFMWWPALGGLAVGLVGLAAPRTLGVGYDNIEQMLSGQLPLAVFGWLCAFKLVSWTIALGSGTSGGTLAPLFTVGAGAGGALGVLCAQLLPALGVDARIAALVGMAAIFAGASRALLASVVFAFETTRQPLGLLPLLAGCTAAYLVSCLLMRHSIMTEKIARRGVPVSTEYSTDFLEQVHVAEHGLRRVVCLRADERVGKVQELLRTAGPDYQHQGFPLLDAHGQLAGVLTRRDLLSAQDSEAPLASLVRRAPLVTHPETSLRQAADLMAREHIGRLPVVSRSSPLRVIGIITRSDLIAAHLPRLAQHTRVTRNKSPVYR